MILIWLITEGARFHCFLSNGISSFPKPTLIYLSCFAIICKTLSWTTFIWNWSALKLNSKFQNFSLSSMLCSLIWHYEWPLVTVSNNYGSIFFIGKFLNDLCYIHFTYPQNINLLFLIRFLHFQKIFENSSAVFFTELFLI